ncbi:Very short patch repair protein [compost metagenome]
MDKFTREKRSSIMKNVTSKNTMPEITIRRLLHKMGYRFRLHRKDLPGTPDIVLPKYKKAIFVHGCFWHGHVNCKKAKLPSTNVEFWESKIDGNKMRDERNILKLEEMGWECLIIWTCQIKKSELQAISKKIQNFIHNN